MLQIFEQHAPRQTVDDEVMQDDQQSRRRVRPPVHECRSRDGTVCEIEARLALACDPGPERLATAFLHCAGVDPDRCRDLVCIGVGLFPPGIRLAESQPERVMMNLQLQPRVGEERRVDGLRQLQGD